MLNFLLYWCQLLRWGPCDTGLWFLDICKENKTNEIKLSVI
jgi:hypothetical protein